MVCKPTKRTNAVFRVNDERALVQPGHFRNEIRTALAALGAPHHAVAENILLADNGEISVSKPASRLSTAEAASPLPSFSTSFSEATGLIFSSPCSFSTCSSRSSEPSDQPVIQHLPALGAALGYVFHGHAKTLTRSSLSPSLAAAPSAGRHARPAWRRAFPRYLAH